MGFTCSLTIAYNDILKAKEALADVTRKTPLDFSATFSTLTGSKIYLKLENLQKTGSFKVRGAYNKLANLKNDEKRRVIAASAGNHAQGVAFAASKLGILCTIVMPEMASPAKIAAVSSYGAKIVLAGSTFDESLPKAIEMAKETSATMIHPFDDPYVIAGQGTVALELLEDLEKVDAVVAPVGGGGLISGLALAMKEKHRNVKIVGVQAAAAPSMVTSVQNGKITNITMERTIADGIAVKNPGELTFKIVNEYVDNLVTVDDNEIAEAVYLLLERGKIVAEPAGAAALAALLHHKTELEGKKVAVIVSGGNIDMPLLGQLIQRGLARSGRIVRMVIELFDRPGALKDLLTIIASKNANVLDVQQDRLGQKIGLGKVDVLLSFEIARRDQIKEITKELSNLGYEYRML